ncbi:MAG: DUF1800 domain-containing protein [Fimbriimonadaceae bacterium]|nr:DUF1800 domain-containing protein [Fimbriimonadaceae bacterium]
MAKRIQAMQAKLTEGEKIRHVLRRFGIGAGRYVRQPYEKLGYDGTVRALLYDDTVDEGFPVSPWSFATDDTGKIDPAAYRLAAWWGLRLFMTKRPLQEKLAVFWHDHFALDYEKIGELPTMASYLEILRTHGRGKFRDLLKAIFHQGALYVSLDNHASNKIAPNENFARELFELYTMGVGNYTEKDIQEAARALTGWSLHYLGTGIETRFDILRETAARHEMGVLNVCYVPAIHDEGEKTIFGKTKNFTAEEVLDLAADHPATAKYICRKLWNWFASMEISNSTLERLTRAWKQSDGNIRAVLTAIVEDPEFWSTQCVGQLPKSPVDFTAGLYRCFALGPGLLDAYGKPKDDFTPVPKTMRDGGAGLHYLMTLQGMSLLLPPNVAGWDWGEAWLSTDSLLQRVKLSGVIFWGGGEDRPFAVLMAAKLLTDDKVKTPDDIVVGLADILDVPLTTDRRALLVEACTKHGGLAALSEKNRAANLFARLSQIMFGIPEFQLC